MYKRSEKRWALADANSDGVLIKEEFKDFIHPEESVKIKDVLVDEAMDDFDADKNGAVSLEEFMAHMTDMTEESDRNEPGWEQVQLPHSTHSKRALPHKMCFLLLLALTCD